jgi:hypothetical protein
VEAVVAAAARRVGDDPPVAAVEAAMLNDFESVLALASLFGKGDRKNPGVDGASLAPLRRTLARPEWWTAIVMWIAARHLGGLGGADREGAGARARYVDWHLGSPLIEVVRGLGLSEDKTPHIAAAVELMLAADGLPIGMMAAGRQLAGLFEDPVGRRYLAVNTYRGVEWFNRERLADLLGALCTAACVRSVTRGSGDALDRVTRNCDAVERVMAAAEASDFRVRSFLEDADADTGKATDEPGRTDR